MAVRLHMNVGLVAGERRLPDSADTISVVEPVIGSTSRTKGNLYLLVTGAGGRKLRDATKLVAARISDDYYYDLSAGISVCLRKAVSAANKVLLHSSERPSMEAGTPPPIGIALAVVRGNELYVATLGPAEAYLIRQARLLTLPDADPYSGLPSDRLEGPEVWHGEIDSGDCLVLVSPNVTSKVGLGPLQDTVGQLHPQAAVDQLQRQFGSGSLGATGGDGILIVEATEVASTHRASPLKPVWPNDSLAGAPDRSPIPLADTVLGSVATVQSTAHQAQTVADGWLRRGVYNLFDRMPERPVRRGRVTPMIVRRERRRRAALAVIGLLAVVALVGSAMALFAGPNQSAKVDTQVTAQQAFQQAEADLDAVYGSGRNLVLSDSKTAYAKLSDAYQKLDYARKHGYTDARVSTLLNQAITGLDAYYGISIISPQVVASFSGEKLTGAVLGPDGAAYVMDATSSTIYRVDLGTGTKLPMLWLGETDTNGNGVVGHPQMIATGGITPSGGGDVLVVDDFNNLWRVRPTETSKTGRRTIQKVFIPDNASWGLGSRAIGTFVINTKTGAYNFYIVLPSASQVKKYQPAADGSGYLTGDAVPYLIVDQDVSGVDDMYLDGTLYLLNKGTITRYEGGNTVKTWKAQLPPDTADTKPGSPRLRPDAPVYTRICADNPAQDQGNFYAYDSLNRRIVMLRKADGSIQGDFMAPANTPWLSDVRGLFVTTDSSGGNPVLYWVEAGNLLSAQLSGGAAGPVSTATSAPNGSDLGPYAPTAAPTAAPAKATAKP